MSSVTILDARTSLAMDLDGVNLIEAGAGTGKTYTIANLYLRHVLAGHRPAEILVVSFTNAATEELHQRIHAKLYQALQLLDSCQQPEDEFLALLLEQQSSLDPEQREIARRRIQYALRSMDESMISTIHGFCHSALQDHALLCNRRFESEIIADDDDYWEGALKDWWRRTTYPLSPSKWSLFNQAVSGLGELLRWHKQLRSHPRDQLLPAIESPLADLLAKYCNLDFAAVDSTRILRDLKARTLWEANRYAQQQVSEKKRARAQLAYQDQLDLLFAALQHPAGAELARRLRIRFPVAMIDEFQDTDEVQLSIFKAIYFSCRDVSLTLIGDPKQAIYGFRGGDIFTYVGARSHPGLRVYALQVNWRSQAGLVNAVNHFFCHRRQPFIFDQAIDFRPAQAAPINDSARLLFGQTPAKSATLWKIPLRENGKTLPVGEIRRRLNDAVVAEISRLLDASNRAQIQGRALQKGDIAVLVREHAEGEELRSCLAAAGIASVTIGSNQVFESLEARGLLDLLDGIAHPADDRLQRRARACSLFNPDYLTLAQLVDDDESWQRWTDQLHALHLSWTRSGFIAMFQQMLRILDPAKALAGQTGAERKLTNLFHLAELLQQQSRAIPGIDALVNWFRRQMQGAAGDETELRLETDTELVKIVTVHKSKGLEYPVVLLPFLWRCKLATKTTALLRFHDNEHRAWVDLGSEEFEQHGYLAERERLAEDLRLLYVAMTRARSKLYLAWGDVGDGRSKGQPKHSALAYLLHSRQSPADLETRLPAGFDSPTGMLEDLERFAAACDDIELVDLPGAAPTLAERSKPPATRVSARRFSRELALDWRINSFSGLTRDVHQVANPGERQSLGDPILDFPAGSHIGLLLHQLLEHIDFRQDIGTQAKSLIEQFAPAYGINNGEQLDTLHEWLQLIVNTELDQDGLKLAKIDSAQRLNEIKFDFALDRFDVGAVNRLLQQDTRILLQPIGTADFRGLLTGVIDLVFEYRGKYYLADYKSNYLGATLADYAPQNLARAMYDRRYDLQALLYSVALHRYLRQRLPEYSYAQHFGGCFYLFLRAMRPTSGNRYGVHFECPTPARLEALDGLFAFSPAL